MRTSIYNQWFINVFRVLRVGYSYYLVLRVGYSYYFDCQEWVIATTSVGSNDYFGGL